MSAYEEFDKERRAVDGLLQRGYGIMNITEDLDGAEVTFVRNGSEGNPVKLLLLTADARKHVATVVFAGGKPAALIEAPI
ncbi:hypothetical protein [Paenibacillus sp. FSL R7-0273]|uniref:hypothetical protein n=1 Tax=Paenibacillus sp. FSL R7-0273 TaxID=1536772 RepID=UPI00063FB514|nr:hypothetical protein [Paenibacillus sp. FSL R7-0273]OMF92423.1 hypothetical protein BK144_13900 [Paenibacillus sp. FSL R7-0273]